MWETNVRAGAYGKAQTSARLNGIWSFPKFPMPRAPCSFANAAKAMGRVFRVMIVDDSETALEATSRYLQLAGHTVLTAADGHSAIASAREFKPEKVLLDLSLPDMDGYEVLRRLRALEDMEETTFIAITGFGEEEQPHAQDAGFAHFITKPVDMEALLKLLSS
jgi:CheY-like chemotaxis protein